MLFQVRLSVRFDSLDFVRGGCCDFVLWHAASGETRLR